MLPSCRCTRLVLYALFLGSGVPLRPLAAQSPRVITFNDALRTALDQSNVIRQSRYAVDLDEASVRQSRAQLLPDLRLTTQGSQNYGRNFSSDEGRILNTSTQALNSGISSSVVLFNGMANVSNIAQAKLNRQASELDLARSRETVVFTVLSNYLTLIEQQEQLRVQQSSLAAQDTLERQVQEFVNAGTRSIADLYQQQASVASARLGVVQAERAVGLAKVDLIQTLKLDPAGLYEFAVPALDSVAPRARTMDMTALFQRALQQRRDVDALQSRLQASETSVRVAGATAWPTLSLSVGYNSSYASSADAAFFNQLDQRRGGSVGLNVSFPIFDRFSSRINSERAQIQQQTAGLALDNLRQEVGLQVRRALLDNVSAQAQLAAAQAQQRAADLSLQAAQERYRAGAATLVEVTQARATSVQAASA
ncbi:MAG: TolC family protein, partial [Gemmatimonadaceae bacterium]